MQDFPRTLQHACSAMQDSHRTLQMRAVEDFTEVLEHACSGHAKTFCSCYHADSADSMVDFRLAICPARTSFHLLCVNRLEYLDAFLATVAADFLQFEGKASKS